MISQPPHSRHQFNLQVDSPGRSARLWHEARSGFGGQVDFIRGAARNEGGKPSSRCLPRRGAEPFPDRADAGSGAGVVTSRADVRGHRARHRLSAWDAARAGRALIRIADPAFRDELTSFAYEARYLRPFWRRFTKEFVMQAAIEEAIDIKGCVEINAEECKGCGLCVEACAQKVLSLAPGLNRTGITRPNGVSRATDAGCVYVPGAGRHQRFSAFN